MAHVDGKFKPLKPVKQAMPGGPLVNATSVNECIPEIKQRVRAVKEWSRATRHGLPFSRMPKLIAIFVVFAAADALNLFPPKGEPLCQANPWTVRSIWC